MSSSASSASSASENSFLRLRVNPYWNDPYYIPRPPTVDDFKEVKETDFLNQSRINNDAINSLLDVFKQLDK
jgi:hypothetical protein